MVPATVNAPIKLKNKYARRCKHCQKWLIFGQNILWYGKGEGISHLTSDECEAAYPDWVMPVIEKGSAEYAYHIRRVGELFDAHPWTFAKTMPEMPHWWTLLKQWQNKDDFWYCVGMIRALGEKNKFKSTTYLRIIIGEWQYWSGPPWDVDPRMEDLMNRARVDGTGPQPPSQGDLLS